MRCLSALALWLTSPAFAMPCLDAGVVEMAAAVEGTGTWQAVVDAHRAALDAGCDDPVIPLNLARAQRRIAEAGPESDPTCAAVDAYRRVLDRGAPSEAIATARARADELSARRSCTRSARRPSCAVSSRERTSRRPSAGRGRARARCSCRGSCWTPIDRPPGPPIPSRSG